MKGEKRAIVVEFDVWNAALLALGLVVRLLPWRAVFRAGRVMFIDTDDYYHLRRIMTAAADFPRLPYFDQYLGFPGGWNVNWPPLYDLFVGGLARLASGGSPELGASSVVAALIPPLAGVATLWLFGRVARRALGLEASRWALGFAAVLPPLAMYTLLGRPDHHCFENFWFMAAALCVLKLFDARDERQARRAAAALAVAGALGVLFWIASIVFTAAVAVWALDVLRRRQDRPGPATFWLGAALLAEAVLIAPVCLTSPWAARGLVLFDAPSAFQPLALAAAGLWIWCLHSRRAAPERTGRAAAAGLAALAASAALASLGVASLARYAAAPLPVFRTFSEMQPLLKPFGAWSLAYLAPNFGWAFWFLVPLAVGLAREDGEPAPKRLILAWAAVMAALALWQTRYAYHLALPAAALLGWGAARLAERARVRLGGAAGSAAVAAAAAVLLLPALKNLAGLALTAPENLTGDRGLLEACDWLRENTPPTRSLWRDEGTPQYGVYSLHTIGDQVAAIAQRPAAAGSMHFMPAAIMDSLAFFFEEDAEKAYQFLTRRGFRYLLLTDALRDGTLPTYARLFQAAAYDGSSRDRALVYPRLFFADGSAAEGAPPVERFRLVFESSSGPAGAPSAKVFEAVPGARLEGPCRGGSVEASIGVETSAGRRFVYRDATRCPPNGRFGLSVPYPGTYQVQADGRAKAVAASEGDVRSGRAVALPVP